MPKILDYIEKFLPVFHLKEKIRSPKNGLITVAKISGSHVVMAGGYFQSGPYVTALWRKTLGSILPEHKVHSVLMLGLGGGGGVEAVRENFLPRILLRWIMIP